MRTGEIHVRDEEYGFPHISKTLYSLNHLFIDFENMALSLNLILNECFAYLRSAVGITHIWFERAIEYLRQIDFIAKPSFRLHITQFQCLLITLPAVSKQPGWERTVITSYESIGKLRSFSVNIL